MDLYQLDVKHRSQWWAWGETEWLVLFIAQVWSKTHRFPRSQQELEAIDYQGVKRDFEKYRQEQGTCQARGITLEENWIAVSILTRQLYMCLRNAQEYWPADAIPEPFKKAMSPADIWKYVYYSFKQHREQAENLSVEESEELPRPDGILGIFLGHCAHIVTVVGILGKGKIIFSDPWQSNKTHSLLAKGENTVGIKATRIGEYTWSITKREFTDSVLLYMVSKASYDYFSLRDKM